MLVRYLILLKIRRLPVKLMLVGKNPCQVIHIRQIRGSTGN